MLTNFKELENYVLSQNMKKRIALANAHDEPALSAVVNARRKGVVEGTLVGKKDEIIAMLDEEVPGISFYIGGSGVAAYDHPIIKALMPKIAARLHYAPYDIGIARRMSKTMTNRDVVNIPRSYQDGVKTHRAWDDITAHFEEGVAFQTFFQKAVQLGAHNG